MNRLMCKNRWKHKADDRKGHETARDKWRGTFNFTFVKW